MGLCPTGSAGWARCRQHSHYPIRAGKPAWRLVRSWAPALEARPARSGNGSLRTLTPDERARHRHQPTSSSGGSSSSRPDHVLDLACLTEGRLRQQAPSRSYPRNGRPQLSSPERCALLPREARKPLPAALHLVPASSRCGSIAPGLSTAIEVAMGATRQTHGDDKMATIGTFTSNANGLGYVLGSVL